jgi:DNA repair protein RecO (recombination protein O)
MHHIHHTEGIILGSRNHGEAGRYFYIFTRDLGLVYAVARGVRKLSSKLRFVLQDFAYIRVDFVAGRDLWRVTSASKMNSLEGIASLPENMKIFANISRLLRRLLSGVEPNGELFTDVLHSLEVLERTEGRENLRNLEVLIVLRILNNLGYIGEHETLQHLTKSPLEESIIFGVSKDRKKVLTEVNKALKETQL